MIEENIKRSKKEEEKKTQTKRTRTRKENKTEKKGTQPTEEKRTRKPYQRRNSNHIGSIDNVVFYSSINSYNRESSFFFR